MLAALRRIVLAVSVLSLVGAAGLAALARAAPAVAAEPEALPYLRVVQKARGARLGVPRPAGLAFSPGANAFLLLDGQDPSQSSSTLFLADPVRVRRQLGTVSLAPGLASPPMNVAFVGKTARLVLLNADTGRITEIPANGAGVPDPAAAISYPIDRLGLVEPRGIAADPQTGRLFVLDAAAPRVVQVDLGAGLSFQDGNVSVVDLRPAGLTGLRGLAFNPVDGHLYTLSPATGLLYELSTDGRVVAERDLASVANRLRLWDAQAMVFAPSGNQTDDPATQSLFVADAGPAPGGRIQGQVVELTLTAPPGLRQSARTAQASQTTQALAQAGPQAQAQALEAAVAAGPPRAYQARVVDTGAWSPPSPDPSGIAYLPSSGTYLISDGEVDEMPIFTGKNLYEMSPNGTLVRTHTAWVSGSQRLVPNNYSKEPTGVGYNPLNGHYFVSDDDQQKVFEIDPGPDRLYGTSDDIVTMLSVPTFGAVDPEGLAFDTLRGHLLIADGLNNEIWDVSPGANGRFDGVAPTGDDQVTHCDTSTNPALQDPEGIEFNPDNGHIYVTSSAAVSIQAVVEMTTTCAVIATYRVPNPNVPAGLAYGPSSGDPNTKHIYVVARGVDNNSDPNENDGRVYEIGLEPTDIVFADDFESGKLLSWTFAATDAGDLSVTAAAALVGSRGAQIVVDDNNQAYLSDEWPEAESRYRARFSFHPNGIAMANGDSHFIFLGSANGTPPDVVRIEFRSNAGSYEVRPQAQNDAGMWISGGFVPISNAPHVLEIDWQTASAVGANDGSVTLSVDGVQRASASGIDNDTRLVDKVKLGAVNGIDAGTRGTYYFDAFESFRTGAGQSPPTSTPGATNTPTRTPTSTNTPIATSTNTPVATSTNTPVATGTFTPTGTATRTATSTLTPVATGTVTATATPSPTGTRTATSSPTAIPGGGPGRALDFSAAKLNVASTGPFAGIIGPQTVEAWIRPRTIGLSMILVHSDAVLGWVVETDERGYIRFWGVDTSGAWQVVPGWDAPLEANTWAHVAVTYDGSDARVYLNGALVGSGTIGALSSGPRFHLGQMADFPHFDGQIDEVRLSTGVRYTADFTPPGAPFAPDAATLALYHLDEGAGQTSADASGHGHPLTLGATSAAEASDPTWVTSTAPLGAAPPASATPILTSTPTPTFTSTPIITSTSTSTSTATPTASATLTPIATGTSSPTAIPGGGPGRALDFSAAKLSVAGTGPFLGISGPQTAEAWIRPRTIGYSMILVQSDDVVGWLLEMDDFGYIRFWGVDTSGAWQVVPGWDAPVEANTWAHVAVTYDGSVARIYVDGALAGSATIGALSRGPNFRLAELSDYPHFDGQIDEVRLSSGLRYTAPFTPPSAPFASDAATLALYHLDEGAGQTSADASGHGHPLTLGTTSAVEASDPTWAVSTAPLGGS